MRISNFLLIFFTVTVTVTLGACAAMKEDYNKNFCTPENAFEEGLNHANENGPMDSSRFTGCPREKVTEVKLGYRKGYLKGKEYQKKKVVEINVNKNKKKKKVKSSEFGTTEESIQSDEW